MESTLTTSGIIFMIIGWGGVTTLLVWTMTKVLRGENKLD